MKRLILTFFLFVFVATPAFAAGTKESVFERIMRTGTIRCGHVPAEPALIRDPNTGAFSGIMYDFLQEMARRLSLKVEMTGESGFGTMGEDIRTGKFDLICTEGWAYVQNVRAHLTLSRPLYYSAVGVFVRADDNRFTSDLSKLNNSNVTISAIDETAASTTARDDFPKAKVLSLPAITPYSYNLVNVVNKKADVTFESIAYADKFMQKQGGHVLKNIAKENPIRVMAAGVLIPMGDAALEQMVNTAVDALVNEGFIEKLLVKYEGEPGTLLRVARPFAVKP